ncbi:hypothetical protein BOTBODRAFT_545608 [Botryobasidium botryosum FD-172 SS1]|uniref:Uncharacterized protein n=1 Tax=Botryobasidium botryosum (strain FD-172 SS1) TaxID=930990 RepID=A0A067MQF6_BOTB1|nr:hypothetical protein BOTBODRAFT_545608 [Botryobasidium botryosum FD-172 SS1]
MSGGTVYFYQLGGFGGHTNKWGEPWNNYFLQDKNLSETVAGAGSPIAKADGSVELVLGMKPTGATYILLPADLLPPLLAHHNLPPVPHFTRPLVSTSFDALSPLNIKDPEQLRRKLAAHRSTQKKGNRNPTDMSKANKAWEMGSSTGLEHGAMRCAFEHARLAYQVLARGLNPEEYGVSWRIHSSFGRPKVVAFATNVWDNDAEVIFDVGWTEVGLAPDGTEKQNSNYIWWESMFDVKGKTKRGKFMHGTTEKEVPQAECAARLKALVGRNAGNAPTILLVHDAAVVRKVFENHGIDTSEWVEGLGDLLEHKSKAEEGVHHNGRAATNANGYRRKYDHGGRGHRNGWDSRSPKREHRDRNYHDRDRNRSRSPKREQLNYGHGPQDVRYKRSASPSSSAVRYSRPLFDSPPRSPEPPSFPPVFLVSAQTLFVTMTMAWSGRPSLHDMCTQLRIPARHGVNVAKEWCAGNEAHLIVDIIAALLGGGPIDDRLAELSSTNPVHAEGAGPSTGDVAENGDTGDEDSDAGDRLGDAPDPYGSAAPKPEQDNAEAARLARIQADIDEWNANYEDDSD